MNTNNEQSRQIDNQTLISNANCKIGYKAYQKQGHKIVISSYEEHEDHEAFVYGVHLAQLDYINTQL